MTVTEKTILTLLKKGYSQKEIAEHFKQNDSLRISGLSSIEKTIKSLKKQNNVISVNNKQKAALKAFTCSNYIEQKKGQKL